MYMYNESILLIIKFLFVFFEQNKSTFMKNTMIVNIYPHHILL